VLRAADALVGRVGRARHADRPVALTRYQAHVAFHNPPESQLYFRDVYEPDTTAVLRSFLRPGDCAVDVGANCGVVTLEMASAVGATGRVLSIDPSPAAVARTQAQVDLNGMRHVRVIRAGLDATDGGLLSYYLAPVGIGALPESEARSTNYTTDERIDVPVRTLDTLLAGEPRVTLLKCDTDGHEARVFAGAQQMLERDRPLLYFEITPDAMQRRGDAPWTFLATLDALGYRYLTAGIGRVLKSAHFAETTSRDLVHRGYTGNLVGYQPGQPRHLALARCLADLPAR
jgi:FkbM family methyltransferase